MNAIKMLAGATGLAISLCGVSGYADDDKISVVGLLQNAKIMEYPDISMNHMDYRGLVVEYAMGGQASITQLTKKVTSVNCGAAVKNVEQLEVSYQGAKVLLRVKDMTRDTVKFLGPIPNENKTLLGQLSCDSADTYASLSADFNAKQADFIKTATQKSLSNAPALVETFVRDNIVVKFRPVEFTSFQIKSAGTDFASINQAYDIATKAYDMIESKDSLVEPSEGIKGAIDLWEMAMGNAKLNARPDAKIIKSAIAYNLSSAYLISMNYMQASAYHKLAFMLNNESGNTLKLPDNQGVIDRQLRNRSLSNTVPNNVVALITLERMGSEYLRHMEITPLGATGFSELERQAGQIKTASAE